MLSAQSPPARLLCTRALFRRRAHAHAIVPEALKAHKPEISKLPNGTTVVSCENYAPVARLSVVVRAGPRYEPDHLVGASHLLRRCVGVLGTERGTAFGLVRSLQQMGASLTCSSTREHVSYTVEANRDFLSDAAEFVTAASMRPQFDRHWEFHEVLKYAEADRVRLDQSAEAGLLELLHDAAYRTGLKRGVFCADYRTRESIDHEHLTSEFHALTHRPVGTCVVAIGASHADAVAIASKLEFPQAKAKATEVTKSRFGGGERRLETGDDLVHAALACEAPGYTDVKGALSFGVLGKLVGGTSVGSVKRGSNSVTNRLGAALAKDSDLKNPHLIAPLEILHSDSGLFGFYAVAHWTEVGTALRAGKAAFAQQLKAAASGTINESELSRAKLQLKSEFQLADESSAEKFDRVGSFALETGRLLNTAELLSELDRVKSEDVAAAAKRAQASKLALAVTGALHKTPTLDELL